MAQGLQVWDASGNLVLDTNDRIVGGTVIGSTGTTNGSMTMTPKAGQQVEWAYEMPGVWIPSGKASRWPSFTVSGNTISWEFNPTVTTGDRVAVAIMGVTY